MPQGNVKTPAKKTGAAPAAAIIKKPAAKKAASTAKPQAKTKTDSKAATPVTEKKPAVAKRPTVKKASAKAAKGDGHTTITPEQRYRMICDAAYFRAERRGFIGGNPHEDWVAAETEIDSMLGGLRH